ncbi:putative sugar-phosphate nucleotidyl transferase [Aeropyrum pernix K1]|uniref:Sugar-phosphate nucleotidyl transferase n=1 Tax=Aeropyrum pernix (strain ATCC 700893 / DSM 11879 / JCM 9820 / NBRC 100138 / K1) TaxID=272557 RepID=Q9YFJ3_AERPE|nr:nucleotidyltransferase family protein [Aeropyrum pernix]BAA79168.2 putative sugar-phosphate nucleotidyl transferase [Aeropyrum pernix K1]
MSTPRTALILAGGKGRRFRPYTDLIPKPMIPLGRSEKPLLEYVVKMLALQGVENIVLLVGYKWRYIYNYFGRGEKLGVKIDYSIDDERYSGTGGSVLKALEEGRVSDEDFLVWYGDIIAEVGLASMYSLHRQHDASATLAVAERYQVPVGVVKAGREGVIEDVEEKPWIGVNVFIGVAIFRKEAFREAAEGLGTSFDIMGDMMPILVRKSKAVAYIYDGPWFDVGSLERYEKLREDVISRLERKLFPESI